MARARHLWLWLFSSAAAALQLESGRPRFSRRDVAATTTAAAAAALNPIRPAAAADEPELTALRTAQAFSVLGDSTKALAPRVQPRTPAALVRAARSKRAVFLGEHHNSEADHLLQAGLVRELHATGRREMAVGLEAVQRQFQPALDAYVAGAMDEAELEAAVEWRRRWFWPFAAYLPVFRACRELSIPLLALNVDSEDLSKVEVGGLPALPEEAFARYMPDRAGFAAFAQTTAFKEYVAYVLQPSYVMHQKLGILRNTISGQRLESDMSFRNFFSGRVLWDEAMGSASAAWCNAHPSGLLVGLVGSDHVKFGCGVPARAARQLPGGLDSVATVMLNPQASSTCHATLPAPSSLPR